MSPWPSSFQPARRRTIYGRTSVGGLHGWTTLRRAMHFSIGWSSVTWPHTMTRGFGYGVKLSVKEEKMVLENRSGRPAHISSLEHCLAQIPIHPPLIEYPLPSNLFQLLLVI